jgi:hypothetical protein
MKALYNDVKHLNGSQIVCAVDRIVRAALELQEVAGFCKHVNEIFDPIKDGKS